MNVKIIDRAVITDESVYPDPRYCGGVFGYIKGTDIDVVTSPIAEYDINKNQTEVRVTTINGSEYIVEATPDFIKQLLKVMKDA